MRKTRALPAAALAGLVLATPAAAINGGLGVSDALHHGKVLTVSTTTRDQHSCQANRTGDRLSTTPAVRKFAPVACEQPPKSNLLTPDAVSKAVANAIAAIG